jgi:hypothetical protein
MGPTWWFTATPTAGAFAGRIGEVDVFNVSVPVIDRDYWLFELEPVGATGSSIR